MEDSQAERHFGNQEFYLILLNVTLSYPSKREKEAVEIQDWQDMIDNDGTGEIKKVMLMPIVPAKLNIVWKMRWKGFFTLDIKGTSEIK